MPTKGESDEFKSLPQDGDLFRELYDGCPVLLRTINEDGIILSCNQTYAKALAIQKIRSLEDQY